MLKSNLTSIFSIILLSTIFASAEATISPSADPIMICDNTPYFELNAVGDSNPIYTWTLNDDTHSYGATMYFVPSPGDSNNIIRLYRGVIENGTVDKDPDKLLDEVTINVNDCNV